VTSRVEFERDWQWPNLVLPGHDGRTFSDERRHVASVSEVGLAKREMARRKAADAE
jgi:hypothetical protein